MTVHNDLKRVEIDNAVLKALVAEFEEDKAKHPDWPNRICGGIRPRYLYRLDSIRKYGEHRIRAAVDRLCARGEAVRARGGEVRWRSMEEREAAAKRLIEENAIRTRLERVTKKLCDRGFRAEIDTLRDGGWISLALPAAEQFAQLCIDHQCQGDWKPEPEDDEA